MSTKQYKGPQTISRIDGSWPINNWPNQIAHTQTYPAVRQRNKLSLCGNPIYLYFYQKLTSGRRCSCWASNASPSANCYNCFSTGIVGGYNKFGTSQAIIDTTHPNLVTVGLIKDVAEEGPEVWTLDDNNLRGIIQTKIWFDGNWGPLDYFNVRQWIPDGGAVGWYFKPLNGPTWISLNIINLTRYLDRPQILEIKSEISRPGLKAQSPVVVNAYIRVKRTPQSDTVIKADRPKVTKSFALEENGVLDEWTTANFWLDETLANITSYDWFYDVNEKIRWKVVDVNPLAPDGYLLCWDCQTRRVHNFESLYNFPI